MPVSCSRCGHLILNPEIGCQVCPVIDAETSGWTTEQRQQLIDGERPRAASSAPVVSQAPPSPPGPVEETFHDQERRAAAETCPRCGHVLMPNESSCGNCKFWDQQAIRLGWSSEKLDFELAEERGRNSRAYAQIDAEEAGKSDQQIWAEMDATQKLREEVEVEIPWPAAMQKLADARKAGIELTTDQLSAAEQEEVRQYRIDKRFALPLGVAPLINGVTLRCSLISNEVHPGCAVGFDQMGQWFGTYRDPEPDWISANPWSEISAITIDGPETIESRVTVPRAVGLGLLSLAAKKKIVRSFITVERYQEEALLYEVTGLTPVELRAQLAPRLAWFEQHRPRLQALHQLNS